MAGTVHLDVDNRKGADLVVEPSKFNLEPEEIKKVRVGLTVADPDFIMKLITVRVDG